MPAIAELTGTTLVHPDIDGQSIVPVLWSVTAPSPHEVFHWHVGGGAGAQWAVLSSDRKLIGNTQDKAGKVKLKSTLPAA